MISAFDPGASGGVAFFSDKIEAQNLPKNGNEWKLLIDKLRDCETIYVENLWSTPQRRHLANWVLSGSFHQIMMAIELAGKKATLVTPENWQKRLGEKLPKEYNEKKRRLVQIAKTIYPKATLKTADAVCMVAVLTRDEFRDKRKVGKETEEQFKAEMYLGELLNKQK